MDEDEQIRLALELSAREHDHSRGAFVMDSSFESTRRSGKLLQLNTLDQFAEDMLPSIKEFQSPSALCGYFSCVNALVLAEVLRTTPMDSTESVTQLQAALQDTAQIVPMLRDVMRYVSEARANWIAQHPADFHSEREKREYMTAWIANYEISDYMQRLGERTAGVEFFRFNQWPERNTATHEEKERLVEEEIFGGVQTGDKERVKLEPGASRFFVEDYWPAREFTRCEEWRPATANPVMIVDLNGHFAVATTGVVDGQNVLVLINTTEGNYLKSGAVDAVYDLVFGAEDDSVQHP